MSAAPTVPQPSGDSGGVQTREVKLDRDSELRFEAASTPGAPPFVVRLESGTCECFGTELAPGSTHRFPPGTSSALHTWHGCTLRVESHSSHHHFYTSAGSPGSSSGANARHVLLHEKLEESRALAERNASLSGPVVVVCGPTDSGKTSLCRTLLAMAARSSPTGKRRPIFVDLDVGQNSLTAPGVLCAAEVSAPPPVVEGLAGLRNAVIALFYGHASLDRNPTLYRSLLTSIAAAVREKMDSCPESRVGGVIINTCGWIDGPGFKLLLDSIMAFPTELVIALDQERLSYDLKQALLNEGRPEIEVELMQKSGGVVVRSQDSRRSARSAATREYFYGTPGSELNPHSAVVPFSEVRMFRVGGSAVVPLSALPIGHSPQSESLKLFEVAPSQELTHSVAAVVHCADPSEIITANVAGFVKISRVDLDKSLLTLLTPCPGPLPSKFLVVGSLKWVE